MLSKHIFRVVVLREIDRYKCSLRVAHDDLESIDPSKFPALDIDSSEWMRWLFIVAAYSISSCLIETGGEVDAQQRERYLKPGARLLLGQFIR